MLPNVTNVKQWGWIILGVVTAAYVLTRLTPGVAAFIGLQPRADFLPQQPGMLLTPPLFLNRMRPAAAARANGNALPSVRSILESATA